MANYVELGYDGNLSIAEIIAAAKGQSKEESQESTEKEGE